MIKLGRVNRASETMVVNLYQFNMDLLAWSKVPKTIEFLVEKSPLGSGGFRKAFKTTSQHRNFAGMCWVIKYYLPEALKCMADTGQSAEEHNQKVVKVHFLARNFTMQLKEQRIILVIFLRYRKTDEKEYVTIEEFIPGHFTKYINKNGLNAVEAECLTHYSYH